MIDQFSIGLDFGTESARALLVNIENGKIIAQSSVVYPHGVIDAFLPDTQIALPPNYALQDPGDWLLVAEKTIKNVLEKSNVDRSHIVGIGVDFTSCTLLPVLENGEPLCKVPRWQDHPHTFPKLWKHHGAQNQANRINLIAKEMDQAWLPRYGGIVSSEWLLPKVLEVLEQAPDIYNTAHYFIEGADWLVWQLTGSLTRNTCCAGYKGTWNKSDGYPDNNFLKAVNPKLSGLFEKKIAGPMTAPGTKVGTLTKDWSRRLGIPDTCAVSSGIIDAHSAVIGGGVFAPGTMFMIMGTSTCHMLFSDTEVLVEGISGVVEDGIIPGLFGYEAGQACVGDIFGWFVDHCVPHEYWLEAQQNHTSLHDLLTEKAKKLHTGESGLLALDWWNGCRTPYVDADLSGMIMGFNLSTKPEEIYRALIESTAFGTKTILALFDEAGVGIRKLSVGGGLIKNELLIQIYADVTHLPIEIASSEHASALGAAILGAVAGGAYRNIKTAVKNMVLPPLDIIEPNQRNFEIYDKLYIEYRKLTEQYGRNNDSSMKNVFSLRRKVIQPK